MNIQCDAVTWVKDRVEERKNMRRGRRFRKTPCRQPRWSNRGNSLRPNRIPPSTKARWDLKLEIVKQLSKIYPITDIVYEDIKAKSKESAKKWNKSFSPLEIGKKYFKNTLIATGLNVSTIEGGPSKIPNTTSYLRAELGLKKDKGNKMRETFDIHAVDSWVMANFAVGGHTEPDNKDILVLSPIKYPRRQLHYFQYSKGNIRSRFGGTRSLGFKKGSVVRYSGDSKAILKKIPNRICVVGGNEGNKLSICFIHGKGIGNNKENRINSL
jgi:hypothetical protein